MTWERARETYERAHIGGRVDVGGRPAVVVVDFCLGFTDPACSVGSELTAEVEATRRLLDAARRKGLLVVFTTIAYEPHLVDAGVWLRKMPGLGELVIGSKWVELDDRLGRRENEPLLAKKGASAFFGTNLGAILAAKRIDTVLLCGATTSGCVRATAVDLCQYGYPTLVPRECVGDRAREPHDANLFDIDAKYADVVSLGEALDYVDRLT